MVRLHSVRVILQFNEQVIVDYARRNAPLFFGICWESDEDCYPSSDWMDFGTVVLGWWMLAVMRMINGSREQTLMFMDGPYSITVNYEQDTGIAHLYPQGTTLVWHCRITDVARELIRAAGETIRTLQQMHIGIDSQEELRKTIRWLQDALRSPGR